MDEVARERAQRAHDRLDGINGQIGDLRDAQVETVTHVASLSATVSLGFKIAGAVAVVALGMLASTLGVLLTRDTPPPRNATQRVEKATGGYAARSPLAGRERGAHSRLDGP